MTVPRVVKVIAAVLLLSTGGVLAVGLYRNHRASGASAVERGRRVADRLGCFACHGPGGMAGIRNPTKGESEKERGYVPPWYNGINDKQESDEEEIRDWILDGMPASDRNDPRALDERRKQLIHMPAYKGMLSEAELRDLIAYHNAVSWFDSPKDPSARSGRALADKFGCFGCHGPEGRGLVANPRSLMGYIPSWTGPDFAELVRDDGELEEWIMKGSAARLRENPVARHFLEGQAIKMPGYEKFMGGDQLQSLKDYILWLRRSAPAKGGSK